MRYTKGVAALALVAGTAAVVTSCTAHDCSPGVVQKGANSLGVLEIKQDKDGKVVQIQPQGVKGRSIVKGCQQGEHYPECGH